MRMEAVWESPIGPLLIAADGQGICEIRLLQPGENCRESGSCALIERAVEELEEYFSGVRKTFDLPLSACGTAFEQDVWQMLATIPFGETRSYGQLAAQLGRPGSARAVGGACARNPLLIVVPCHRVIASSGALTGFAAGLPAKKALLQLEGHVFR